MDYIYYSYIVKSVHHVLKNPQNETNCVLSITGKVHLILEILKVVRNLLVMMHNDRCLVS